MSEQSEEVRKAARFAAQGLRDGTLTVKDVMGLTIEEIAAIRALAARYQTKGELDAALRLYGMLASLDPYNAEHWQSMAEVHQLSQSYVGALLCYEVVALLRGRDPQCIRAQADCVQKLGRPEDATKIRGYARAFSMFGSSASFGAQRSLRV